MMRAHRSGYLLVDTPPGTSDEHLALVNLLKESGIDGAILLSSPMEVSVQDVRKEIDFCRKVHLDIIGIVENMAKFSCPNCKVLYPYLLLDGICCF